MRRGPTFFSANAKKHASRRSGFLLRASRRATRSLRSQGFWAYCHMAFHAGSLPKKPTLPCERRTRDTAQSGKRVSRLGGIQRRGPLSGAPTQLPLVAFKQVPPHWTTLNDELETLW